MTQKLVEPGQFGLCVPKPLLLGLHVCAAVPGFDASDGVLMLCDRPFISGDRPSAPIPTSSVGKLRLQEPWYSSPPTPKGKTTSLTHWASSELTYSKEKDVCPPDRTSGC